MKKLLLSFALAFAALFANGQQLSSLWYYDATTTATELLTTTSNSYSLAYNKTTGKLYVANRGDEIYILDPDDYSGTLTSIQKSTLPKLKIGSISEVNRFSKVRVDDNGVIYATAMQTNGTVYIYRWASESSVPTSKFFTSTDDASLTGRVGDSFGIYGTGNDTFLYLSGNTSTKIFIFKVASGIPAYYATIDISAAAQSTFTDVAKGSISPETSEILWLGSTDGGVNFRRIKIDLTTKTFVSSLTVSSTNANFNCSVGEYVNDGGTGYFLAASGRSIANQNVVHLTRTGPVGASTPTYQSLHTFNYSRGTYITNSGYADVAFKKNADNTTTFFVLTSQNYLGAVKTNVPLPVSLTSFDAALVRGQSTLTWETSSETNNKGFEVLRSTDGENFTKIDFVTSKAQNGNSASALSYSYVDRTAKAGINYYKLNQVDLDGKSELFEKAVSVNVSLSGADVVVFPNPATSYVSVNAGSADYKDVKYELFDAVGKKVMSEKAKAEQQDISLSKLPASVYYLKISKAGEVQKTVKLIKQ